MSATSRARYRRPRWWIGGVLVLAGAVWLGWVAWQIWGTNWQSERTHRQIVETLERQWQVDDSTVGGVKDPPVPPDRPADVAEEPASEPEGEPDAVLPAEWTGAAILRIPRFGAEYAVPVLPGVGDDVLAAGVGHFEDGAGPGEVGNYALAGHRITHGEPLRRMPELRPGDEIVVETATERHHYVLDTGGDDLVVPFTETWVVDPRPLNPRSGGVQPPSRGEGQRLITLTTCAELFHTDKRLIAFGHLRETVTK